VIIVLEYCWKDEALYKDEYTIALLYDRKEESPNFNLQKAECYVAVNGSR